MKTVYFLNSIKEIEATKTYPKNVSGKCFSCIPRFKPDYLETIMNEKGEIIMVLPQNVRRERKIDTQPDLWIYADSYVGKSTFIDKVENVLFLNTDGNTDNTTAPVVPIKDEVSKSGRITKRKFAWDVFLDAVAELESTDNDYEAVAIDLVEDLREHCRVYTFDKNGWEHESDGTYGKGWSMVTTEFNNAMKRLKALGYQVIYISKEKVEDITLKGGGKRTTFKPNIDDKTANFLSGTVDLTLRAYVDSDDKRFLQLKKKQNVFGGGRFDWLVDTIPLDMEVFLEELIAAQEDIVGKKKEDKPKRTARTKKEDSAEEELSDEAKVAIVPEEEEKSKRERRSRTKKEEEPAEDEDEQESTESDDDPEEEVTPPARQRRGRNTETEETPPKRERRQRTPVEDDTPPGEGNESTTDEAPSRRRRSRRQHIKYAY